MWELLLKWLIPFACGGAKITHYYNVTKYAADEYYVKGGQATLEGFLCQLK